MVYFIQAGEDGDIKIGFTNDDTPLRRLRSLQISHSKELYVVGIIRNGTYEREQELHCRFHADLVEHEWFSPSPLLLKFIARQTTPFTESRSPVEKKQDLIRAKLFFDAHESKSKRGKSETISVQQERKFRDKVWAMLFDAGLTPTEIERVCLRAAQSERNIRRRLAQSQRLPRSKPQSAPD